MGAQKDGTEDTYFGYIFGAENYTYNENYVPVSLKDVIITDTTINERAFWGCSSLTSLTLPDNLTSIGDSAFLGCSSLTSIALPDSVTSIGKSAFYNCSSLESITIPDGVTTIGVETFSLCSSLESITIPDSVITIGDYAFRGCTSITNITIPDSVTTIGSWVFEDCSSLTVYCEAASRPSGWKSYWNSNCPVTWDCNNNYAADDGYVYAVIESLRYGLKDNIATVVRQPSNLCGEIVIPSVVEYNGIKYSVTSMDEYTFQNCSNLQSIIIPGSVMSICNWAFASCSSLESVTIGNGLAGIGLEAFYGCSSLTNITIPDSVTSIGYSAFSNCASLTSIIIGNNVVNIGREAFYGCTSLDVVYYSGTEKNWAEINIESGNDTLTTATRYCYSETQPTEDGNFWHYAEDGITPVIWTKETT